MKRIFKIISIVLGLLAFLVIIRLYLFGQKSSKMIPISGLDFAKKRLKPCPDRPNCVSSFADQSDKLHYIESQSANLQIFKKIKKAANKLGMKLVVEQDNYLRFENMSMIFRFVDDTEFFLLEDRLHYRAASRVGHSDLGKNRERLTAVIKLIQ